MMGGNVRVGLEDSLYIGRGQLAKSNAEQVAKMRRLVEELGYQVATAEGGARDARPEGSGPHQVLMAPAIGPSMRSWTQHLSDACSTRFGGRTFQCADAR